MIAKPRPLVQKPELPKPETMYRALVDRDGTYEGVFFVGVTTTGIFCRPTCGARKPRPDHVEYFPSARTALLAGYRPCKRCRPMDGGQRPPAWVERLTEAVERAPTKRLTDAGLRAMAIDPARARRYFKQRYGMTFHAFHRARRMGLALSAVHQRSGKDGGNRGPDVDTIAFDHGYESSSGFRDAFARLFGEPPARATGCRLLTARWLETPLGAMMAVARDDGLCMLEFVDRRGLEAEVALLRRRLDATIVPGDHAHLDRIAIELTEYFDGRRRTFTVPVLPNGSAFQERVWTALRHIPYGTTRSYADVARAVDRPGAHRAVGRANGGNRLAIIIPCHRVVRADGSLCGYGGGLWRKRRLLELEGALPTPGQTPRPARAVSTQPVSRS